MTTTNMCSNFGSKLPSQAAQTGNMQYDTVGGHPGHGNGPGDMRYVTAGNESGREAGTEYDAVIQGDQRNGHPDDNLPTYQVRNR